MFNPVTDGLVLLIGASVILCAYWLDRRVRAQDAFLGVEQAAFSALLVSLAVRGAWMAFGRDAAEANSTTALVGAVVALNVLSACLGWRIWRARR